MAQFFKILSVFITCSFAFKIGFPTTYYILHQDFLQVMLVACGGGIAGNILFTYVSAAILKAIHNFRARRGLIHKKKVFSKFNRRVITIKQRFGLAGIAFITPIFLSTPIGAFLAERFFKDKKKIILYLSGATIVWALTMYIILSFFHGSIRQWVT